MLCQISKRTSQTLTDSLLFEAFILSYSLKLPSLLASHNICYLQLISCTFPKLQPLLLLEGNSPPKLFMKCMEAGNF